MAPFRSPSDRKQIGIIAERMFEKNRQQVMTAYYQEMKRPYGYLFVDNQPVTPAKIQGLERYLWFVSRLPVCQQNLETRGNGS